MAMINVMSLDVEAGSDVQGRFMIPIGASPSRALEGATQPHPTCVPVGAWIFLIVSEALEKAVPCTPALPPPGSHEGQGAWVPESLCGGSCPGHGTTLNWQVIWK